MKHWYIFALHDSLTKFIDCHIRSTPWSIHSEKPESYCTEIVSMTVIVAWNMWKYPVEISYSKWQRLIRSLIEGHGANKLADMINYWYIIHLQGNSEIRFCYGDLWPMTLILFDLNILKDERHVKINVHFSVNSDRRTRQTRRRW